MKRGVTNDFWFYEFYFCCTPPFDGLTSPDQIYQQIMNGHLEHGPTLLLGSLCNTHQKKDSYETEGIKVSRYFVKEILPKFTPDQREACLKHIADELSEYIRKRQDAISEEGLKKEWKERKEWKEWRGKIENFEDFKHERKSTISNNEIFIKKLTDILSVYTNRVSYF